MRSNLCKFAGLLPVMLLAAILGSFCSDMQDATSPCFFGTLCTNLDRSPAVVTPRRSLWARKTFLGRHTFLHFAKVRPLVQSPEVVDLRNSKDAPISTTSFSDPSAPPPMLPPVAAPSQGRRHRPVVAPAPQSAHSNTSFTTPAVLPSSSSQVPAPSPPSQAPSPVNNTTPEDCRQPCPDGYTYTPPGAPSCGCVIPMHAELQLGIKLEQLFPLVSELAKELAEGLFLQTSQVRIVGANAVEQNQDQTDVDVDFVPLDNAFDNTTSHLLASRFWSGQVPLNKTLFGTYSVIFVTYPGLPPSPPSPGSITPSPSFSGPSPTGVGLNTEDHMLGKGLIVVIALASAMGVMIAIGIFWLLLLRRSLLGKTAPSVVGPLHAYSATKYQAGGSLLSGSMASSTTISYVSSMATYTGTARTFTIAELERATDNFRPENIVGEGGFGRVYQGVLDDGCEVAVKLLTRDDQQGGREFVAEVEMLSRLHHRNLVKLIGICTEDNVRCLVYELITNGSVESHLHGPDGDTAPLDWDTRVKIALGAARGLAYLHEDSNPRVIHRDFKASNILLEDDYTPKVSDFGLAKAASEGGKEHISTRVMGTFGYVAPEYAMTGHLLVKSDVYSYGVVLLELLSGRKPVDMSQPLGQENLVTWARPLLTSMEGLELLIDPDLKGKIPLDNYARVAAIASMAVQPEVSDRPFMGEVVQALKLVYNDSDASEYGPDRSTSPASDLVETQQSRFLPEASFVSIDYDSGPFNPLDHEQHRPLSASAVLPGSKRLIRQVSDSFRRHSASSPVKTSSLPRAPWYALKNPTAAGSMSEHGAVRYVDPQRRRNFYGLWP